MRRFLHIFVFLLLISKLVCEESALSFSDAQLKLLPVQYNGKIGPLEAGAQWWLSEVYHHKMLLSEHRKLLPTVTSTALEFLWALPYFPSVAVSFPLFWIEEASLKSLLGLEGTSQRFSFQDLAQGFEKMVNINLQVIEQMIASAFFKMSKSSLIMPGQKLTLKIINDDIECLVSDQQLLVTSAPARVPWHFLSTICLTQPYPIAILEQAGAFPEQSLHHLLTHFLQFRRFLQSQSLLGTLFFAALSTADPLGDIYKKLFSASPFELPSILSQFFEQYGKSEQNLPTVFQLRAENILYKYPFLKAAVGCYTVSLLLFCFHGKARIFAWISLFCGFLLQASVHFLKTATFSYAFTMLDCALLVAWLSLLIGLVFFAAFRRKAPLLAALMASEGVLLFSLF